MYAASDMDGIERENVSLFRLGRTHWKILLKIAQPQHRYDLALYNCMPPCDLPDSKFHVMSRHVALSVSHLTKENSIIFLHRKKHGIVRAHGCMPRIMFICNLAAKQEHFEAYQSFPASRIHLTIHDHRFRNIFEAYQRPAVQWAE
jgi:hypothetical protein